MVMIAIIGSMGEGKTLGATYLAFRKYRKDKLNIFANYHIKFPPNPEGEVTPTITFLRGIDDVMNMRNGYAVLDELWASCDCLSGDSIISSMEGSEYFSGGCDSFFSVDFNSCKIIPTENNANAMRKIKPNEKLIKIITRTKEITCSENHLFFTITRDTNLFNRKAITENNLKSFIKEKRASELRRGDRVLTAFKLPSPKEQKTDWKTAQLLGYIMGDGTIEYPHRWAIHLDDKNLECLKKYGRLAKSLGFSISLMQHQHCHAYRLRIFGKKKIQELLSKIRDATIEGKYSTFLEDIPKIVSESDNKIVGAFIRGFYDAEGSIRKETSPTNSEYIRINLPQKNRLVLDKIKYLLLRFGIDTGKIILNKEKERFPIFMFNIKDSLSVNLFRKYIGFSHPEKKIRLNHIDCKDTRNIDYKRINFPNRTKRKIIGDIEIGYITSVEKVESTNDEKLYDVSIPKYENYIANGFIVHNSRQSNSKKNKFVAKVLLKLRKRGVNVAYTCQSFHQADKRVRDVTDFIAKPHLNRDETICRLEIFSMPDMNLVKIRKFPTAPFFKFYDTNEEVGSLFGDDDESKLREINKEQEDKKKEFIDDGDDDVLEEVDSTIEESEANQLPSTDETVPKKSADEEFD